MQCPACHAENPDKARFCLECGAKLARACANCGAELPAVAKFCLECGTKVEAPSAPPSEPARRESAAELLKRLAPKEYAERLLGSKNRMAGERRTVTILFCDVKGSTAMGESLDPEDVLDIMNGAFEVLIPPVYHQEGTLARLMGDAILAFFGAPIAHEDDAERACRAALEIVRGAQVYAAQLAEKRGILGFNVRVGINTGLVVVGEVGSDLRVEYTAMGDTINLAARLEQNAPPGGVLIGSDTYERVRASFDLEAQPPLYVKGKTEPVDTFLVHGERKRGFRNLSRGVEGVETRMIGREAELRSLQEAFAAAVEDGERKTVTIIGEPGVGKSRLLLEFERWLETDQSQPAVFWRGNSRAEMQSTPYALWRDLFMQSFGLAEGEAPERRQERFVEQYKAALPGLPEAEAQAHWIGELLGFDFLGSPHLGPQPDAQEVHDRAEGYLLDFFQARTAGSGKRLPTLLLEDIHWADDSSLELLGRLSRRGQHSHGESDGGMLIISLARPTLFERRPHWGEGEAHHQRVHLSLLTPRETRRLVEEVLKKAPSLPPGLREQIASAAEGNPLFVEETIKVLVQQGLIVKDRDQWQVSATNLDGLSLPPTLAGILQARLDGLPVDERIAVQQAAVVGRVFWDQAVAYIARRAGEEAAATEKITVERWLQALREREIIYHLETSQAVGAAEYTFKHAALRDVAYESILKKIRRQYHSWAADWLVGLGKKAGLDGLIAGHLEQTGQAEQALPYLQAAGRQAASRYANAEAEQYFSRALKLLDAQSQTAGNETRWGLLLAREAVYDLTGQREAQVKDLAALEETAQAMGCLVRQAEARLRQAHYDRMVDDYAAAQPAAEQALKLVRQAGDRRLELEALLELGIAWTNLGSFEPAIQALEQARRLAEESQERRSLASSLHDLGLVYYLKGDCERSVELFEQSLKISRELEDRRGEANRLRDLTGTYHALGMFVQAEKNGWQARQIYRDIGDRRSEMIALNNLANIHHTLGQLATARQEFEQAAVMAREVQSKLGEGLAANNVALVLCDLGEAQAAIEQARRAVEISREMEDRVGEGYALAALGLALEEAQQYESARQAHQQASLIRQELGQPALVVDNLAGLARCALAEHNMEAGRRYIEQALEWIAANGLEGVEYPLRVYWNAWQIYQALGEAEKASQALRSGHALLQSWAARIVDESMRHDYLQEIPLHRQICTQANARPGQSG